MPSSPSAGEPGPGSPLVLSKTTGIGIHDAALSDLILDQARGIGDTPEPADGQGADPYRLLTAVRDLLGARSHSELYTRAVYAARSLLHADAAVWTEATDGVLRVRAYVGLVEPQAFVGPAREAMAEGMADSVVAQIRVGGGTALMFVLSRTPGTFTTADVALLTELARSVGAFAPVVGELEDLQRDAALLDSAIQAVGSGSSIDEVARQASIALGTEVRAEFLTSAAALPMNGAADDDALCHAVPHSQLALQAPGARGSHSAVLARLADLLGVSVAARRTEFDLELRMNGRFLESIVSGLSDQLESATERARLMGIDLQAPHALVTLGGDTPAERPMLDRVAGQLRGLSPHSLLSNFRGCVIILWPTGADRTSEDLQGEVSRLLDAAGPPRLFAGISRVCHKPEAYRDALRESMFAMHVARHTPGPSRVMVAHQLGVFQIAAYIVGSGAEWEAVERTLGRLLDADRRLKSDLVSTLRAYLLHERRTALTARALFIHPNTLRYRLDQIRENIDLDLDDPDARFELLAALQLESILNSLRPDGDNSASRLGRLMPPRGHLANSACGMPFPCRPARRAASAKAGAAGGKPVSG